MSVYVWFDDQVRCAHYDVATNAVSVQPPRGGGATVTTSSRVSVVPADHGPDPILHQLSSLCHSGRGAVIVCDGDGSKGDFCLHSEFVRVALDSSPSGSLVSVVEVTHNDTSESFRDVFDQSRTSRTPRSGPLKSVVTKSLSTPLVASLASEITDAVNRIGNTKVTASSIVTISPVVGGPDNSVSIVFTSSVVDSPWRQYVLKCLLAVRQHTPSISFHKSKITSLLRRTFTGQPTMWVSILDNEKSPFRDIALVLHTANEFAEVCDSSAIQNASKLQAPPGLRSLSAADADILLKEAMSDAQTAGMKITPTKFYPDYTAKSQQNASEAGFLLQKLQQVEAENTRVRELLAIQTTELLASRAAAAQQQAINESRSSEKHVKIQKTTNAKETESLLAVRHEFHVYKEAMEGTLLRLRNEVIELKKKETSTEKQMIAKQKLLKGEQDEIMILNTELRTATKRVEALESSRSQLQGEFFEELSRMKKKYETLEQVNRDLVTRLAHSETALRNAMEEHATCVTKSPSPQSPPPPPTINTRETFVQTDLVQKARVIPNSTQTNETLVSMQAMEEQLQQVLMEAIRREHDQQVHLDSSLKAEKDVRTQLERAQREIQKYIKEKASAESQTVTISTSSIAIETDPDREPPPGVFDSFSTELIERTHGNTGAERIISWSLLKGIQPPNPPPPLHRHALLSASDGSAPDDSIDERMLANTTRYQPTHHTNHHHTQPRRSSVDVSPAKKSSNNRNSSSHNHENKLANTVRSPNKKAPHDVWNDAMRHMDKSDSVKTGSSTKLKVTSPLKSQTTSKDNDKHQRVLSPDKKPLIPKSRTSSGSPLKIAFDPVMTPNDESFSRESLGSTIVERSRLEALASLDHKVQAFHRRGPGSHSTMSN